MTRLAALPGFNVAKGLTSLLDNSDNYLRLLRKFVSAHALDMSLLENCLAEDNPARARRVLHTLRGVAATLGAEQIARAADQLDEAQHTEPALRELGTPQAAQMQAVRDGFNALQAALTPPP